MTRIVVVSPSSLFADGLRAALDEWSDREQWELALQPESAFARAGEPADAYVVHAPDGVAAAALATLPPGRPAVIVADDPREIASRGAGEGRAIALLSTRTTPAQLRAALAAVLAGLSSHEAAAPFPPAATTAAFDHEPLTPREIEVFELLAKGLSNRDIAGVLGISAHTAKYHVGQILAKVGAATRAEAVSCGLKMGVIGL
jgi:DNA-binding NarL/FixJ family response regulator